VPNPTQTIVVGPNGPPPNTGIGTAAKTLKWQCAASGSVSNVTITNGGSAFGMGSVNGDDYEIPYYGSSDPNQTWDYTGSSTCTTPRLDEFAAKLNNGSG